MSAIAKTGFSRNHPAVLGAIKRANIDPSQMTDAQLRSALMASIATEVTEPEEPETLMDRVIDKLDRALFGPKLIKTLVVAGGALITLLIVVQIIKAM